MEEILKQASRARRRLTSQLFLSRLGNLLLLALSISVVGLLIPKLWFVDIDSQQWAIGWVAGSCSVALLIAVVMTVLHRPGLLQAAAEIDRRFGLKERIGSTLHLSPEDRETPIGSALLNDASLRASRIDVRDAFPIGFAKKQLWPLIPALMVAGLIFVPDALPGEESIASKGKKVDVTQVRNSTQPLVEQIKKKREEAEKAGLTDAAEMYKQMEDELEKLRKEGGLDPKEALAKLNDLKKEMEERRKELGSGESLKKNLQMNLKQIDEGPAEKMAKAMQQGDLQQAEDELQKMMDKINSGEMNESEQKQLAKQIDSIQQAIQDSMEKHEQAKQMLEQQLQQAEQAGDVQKAAALRQQLEELQAMDEQMGQLAEMQADMKELQQALESGDTKAAKEAMEKMMAKMEQMQSEMDQLEQLDQMMDQLSDSKNSMNCKSCQGKGCSKCRGMGMKMQKPGNGLGEGNGEGDRPEDESDTKSFDSQVRDQMRAGETVMKGKVAGANKKGVTREEVKEAILTSTVEEAEALESVVLPKAQRDQSREYFDRMREGK